MNLLKFLRKSADVGRSSDANAMMAIPKEEDGPVIVLKTEQIDYPGPACRNREWEWWAALVMSSVGITMLLTPKTIEVGAFRYLLAMGLSASWLWAFFLGVGSVRIAALIANGRLPIYGPHIRAMGCVAGALIWCAMTFALLRLTEDTGTLSIGIGAWGWATVFELRALHRALLDVGSRGQT